MSGFAYRIEDGHPEKIAIKGALTCGAHLVWVHLTTNNEHAQGWLRDEAKLPEHIVEALTAAETRPRCDTFGDGVVLNLRGRSSEDLSSSDVLASIRMWAEAGKVITVTRKPLTALAEVVKAVESEQVHDPGDLITEVAAAITEDLDPEVADLGDMLDDSEARMTADHVFELRRDVTRVRVAAIGYRRFLQPQRAALEKLAGLPCEWLHDDDRVHLGGAADRAARMAEEMESIRERAALTHEALTDLRAEQLDSRSLIISIAAMVFLPLTFITGLYGMNVPLPGQSDPYAFDIILGASALISVGIVVWLVRRHWFR